MTKASALLQASGLGVRLGARKVIDGLDLALRAGEFVALIGPNGAGKTTLVRALAGLLPSTGHIALAGRPLAALTPRERARTIAYLPQGHVFHWPMPVADIVALGRQPHADPFARPAQADHIAIEHALDKAGVRAFAARSVVSLSGGERARVALARALATQAPILLADEPTASLDPRHQLVVMDLLRQIASDGGVVLAIVHDLMLAARFADRVLVMDKGRIVADGRPEQALSSQLVADVFGIEIAMVEIDGHAAPLPRRPL